MYEPFERVAQLDSSADVTFFSSQQRANGATTAEGAKILAIESAEVDNFVQQLNKLNIIYEDYVKLRDESIPLAEKNLNQLLADESQKAQTFDDLVGVLAQVKMDRDAVEALLQPSDTIDRYEQEIQELEKEVKDLEYRLDSNSQGGKSFEEIQLELNSLQRTRDALSIEVDDLRDQQRTLTEDLSSAQVRWHTVREEKIKATSVLQICQKADKELVALAEEKEQVTMEKKGRLPPCLAQGALVSTPFPRLPYSLMASSCHWDVVLKYLGFVVSAYLDLKKVERLNGLQEKHSLLRTQLKNCEARKQEISAELNKSKELLQSQGQLKRNIDDNLNYRKTKAEVERLTRDIELLEERVLSIGSMSSIEADLKRHWQEKERLNSEFNRFQGTLSVYQSNISKHKQELKQTQYKDIEKRYANQLLQLKTTEMANKDLDRYYNALDKALMRFHTMKMEEINKIIKELWQQTYRGQDIDCISINSDSEGAGTRSYSYRVVMQTGDAELEMRGRCSAGQKVLASLIIRLALAETFCLNCGILALDEPTTNLDGPNAESLAAALLRIMEARKGQENFQLIVITHDERFAHLIGQRQLTEKYYRVSKDENQHSIIEAQEIFD
ncbi:hypothetical protein PR202_ga01463 [Eleusine coracana subsp. coracana]|uniref:DNA repair protein RAD50 n=1 Tax=Eleusine coracana subsp. coracana TaxID=191504 RepID=A0AAV5BF02_ELECO|nr:hypothetical protein PR202_ga00776 [Eleusine coracana subsp. coracana]GJM85676.1 hypothetical protein PR202_ga01463 [Eleusine coracana subsp. coracana]